MGYVINLIDADFFMDSQAKPYALADVPGPIDDDGNVRAWLTRADPSEWTYLVDAMRDWRHPIELNNEGNVVGIKFTGEKIGDEREMFDAIAEYVRDGSYVEYVGEDGNRWRYVFDGDSTTKMSHEEVLLEEKNRELDEIIQYLRNVEDPSEIEVAIDRLQDIVDDPA